MSNRRRFRILVWVCAAVALVAGCSSDSADHGAEVRTRASVPAECTQHLGRELLIGPGSGNAPLQMVVNGRLWLRFTGGGHTWRWSMPAATNATVAQLRFALRCPAGIVVAQVHALAEGSTELRASLSSSAPSPPVFAWGVTVDVTRHRLQSPPPPALGKRLRAGGLLVYPKHLYEVGAALQFVVPQVACLPGRNSQTTIGMFGIKRFTPHYRGLAEAAWSAGLTITCAATGSPTFGVGYNGDAQLGHPQPGDIVDVSTSGGGCPSLVIGFRAPHPKDGNVGVSGGPGCRIGTNYHVRAITQPTLVLGADVHGPQPRMDLSMRSVAINGQPYRMAPHLFREFRNGPATVRAHESGDWYRIRISIRNSAR
jgi:hypothetical protein